MFGESSRTASPVELVRPIWAEQEPPWATEHLRVRVVWLLPVFQPVRFDSKPGLRTRLVAGTVVVVGGGGVVVVVVAAAWSSWLLAGHRRGGLVVVVGGGGRTGRRARRGVEAIFSDDTSTASNAEPATLRSRLRSLSFQPGIGRPAQEPRRPVVGEHHPVLLERPQDDLVLGREAADVEARLQPEPRAHRRVGRRPRWPPCGWPARRRRWPCGER